jgi:superfamily II DNA or RNA helicase
LTLQTLTRGDGLLGLRAVPGFGPRGGQLTVARVDWTYRRPAVAPWSTPAPAGVLHVRPWPVPAGRDLAAEDDARDALWSTDLRPLPPQAVQWRSPEAAAGREDLWSLPEESHYADFWAEEVPRLQAAGWQVLVEPGFAHFSVPVERWRLVFDPVSGQELGREPLALATDVAPLSALRQPPGQGSWLLSLGVEVEGEWLDLVPMLADLLKRDGRWLKTQELALVQDTAVVVLRAPGGRRIEAPAGPLKAIVGAMLDLLTDPHRKEGSLSLTAWQAQQLQGLVDDDTLATRAGPQGAWQVQGDEGLRALVQRLREAGTPPPVGMPTGLGLVLRPYQEEGVAWLQTLRRHDLAGILADDMGLGKTAQVLAHLLLEQQAGRLDLPALVVLPTSLIANWQAESARIAPALRVLVLQGADRAADFGNIAGHDVVFTTYPLLWRDAEVLQAQPWHLLVLDEAQMAKNAGSRTARALRGLRARHRLCVTGTPLENHLGELWTHFDLLMPGFLGDARSFGRLWRKPIEENGHTARAALLAGRVRPFILRRRKQDVATELPPRTDAIRHVQLQGQQRALYESVRLAVDERMRRVLQKTGFKGAQIAMLDALLKLRQVCCDPGLVKGPKLPPGMERAKMSLLLDMLPALVAEGRRVLVYSQFTEMLALVQTELEAIAMPTLCLTGDTPPAQRGAVVRAFQACTVPVMLVSLKAGGVGLNLTAADTVIHLDPWWNPAVEEQATARAHRIGQDQPVFVYKLVVQGSIEDRMLALQARKSALAASVLGHDAAGAAKFSLEDLQGLLAPLD